MESHRNGASHDFVSSLRSLVGSGVRQGNTQGEIRALNGLSFAIRRGTILAVLGSYGAGKSTAMHIMAMLSLPDSGVVRITGFDALAIR